MVLMDRQGLEDKHDVITLMQTDLVKVTTMRVLTFSAAAETSMKTTLRQTETHDDLDGNVREHETLMIALRKTGSLLQKNNEYML